MTDDNTTELETELELERRATWLDLDLVEPAKVEAEAEILRRAGWVHGPYQAALGHRVGWHRPQIR